MWPSRNSISAAVGTAAVTFSVWAMAQPPGEGPDGGPQRVRGMRMFPVMAALDANDDGEISAEELARATEALKALDKNSDGKLSDDELRPNFPGREGRPGFAGRGEGGVGPGIFGRGGPEGERGREGMIARLMELDRNKDGKLDKDEVAGRMQGLVTRADADQDGVVTREELEKLLTRERTDGSPRDGGDRGPRAEGDRGPRDGGDRGPRPEGDRGPRDGGDRGPRDGGDRGPRPEGDRGPREGGDRVAFGRGPFGGGPLAGRVEEVTDRVFEFDTDKDGKLSREEFAKYLESVNVRREDGRGRGEGREGRPQRPE